LVVDLAVMVGVETLEELLACLFWTGMDLSRRLRLRWLGVFGQQADGRDEDEGGDEEGTVEGHDGLLAKVGEVVDEEDTVVGTDAAVVFPRMKRPSTVRGTGAEEWSTMLSG
jgi:hypothetical protein